MKAAIIALPEALSVYVCASCPSDALPVALQPAGKAATSEVVYATCGTGEKKSGPWHDPNGVGPPTSLLQLPALEGPENCLQEVPKPLVFAMTNGALFSARQLTAVLEAYSSAPYVSVVGIFQDLLWIAETTDNRDLTVNSICSMNFVYFHIETVNLHTVRHYQNSIR